MHASPMNDELMYGEPMGEKPMHASPMNDELMYGEPMGDKPMHAAPMNDEIMYGEPMGDKPMHAAPMIDELMYAEPIQGVSEPGIEVPDEVKAYIAHRSNELDKWEAMLAHKEEGMMKWKEGFRKKNMTDLKELSDLMEVIQMGKDILSQEDNKAWICGTLADLGATTVIKVVGKKHRDQVKGELEEFIADPTTYSEEGELDIKSHVNKQLYYRFLGKFCRSFNDE